MRLYLSSFDLGDQPEELVALCGTGRRAAIIVNALDNFPGPRSSWLKRQTDKIANLGFRVAELDLRDFFANARRLGVVLGNTDMIWINGGNAFILRRAMKQSGFDLLLKEALAQDRIVYAGFSAGSVIAGPSLKGLEIIDHPTDVPQGYDPETIWDGLGLLPFAIAVHFKSDHSESELVEREIAYFENNNIPYKTLRDGEALVIDGDRQRVVGSKPVDRD
jgi:dipeptidase E